MINRHRVPGIFVKTVVILMAALAAGMAFAARAPAATPEWDWSWHRPENYNHLKTANEAQPSPRYQVAMAMSTARKDLPLALDMLEKVRSTQPVDEDSKRLAAMMQCSLGSYWGTPLSRELCEQRSSAIAGIQHPYPMTVAHMHEAIWLSTNGNHIAASEANNAAAKSALDAGQLLLFAATENSQGLMYLFRGLPAQALKKFESALQAIRESEGADQQHLIQHISTNTAWAQLEEGEVESASELLQETIQKPTYDRYNPIQLIDEANLGRVCLAVGQAQAGYDRLLDVLKASNPTRLIGKAYAYSVLGDLEIALGKSDAGIASFMQALDFGERTGNKFRYQKVKLNYAEALIYLGRFDKAQTQIEESVKIQDERPSMNLARALELRAEIQKANGFRQEAAVTEREAQKIRAEVLGAEYELDLAVIGRSLELAQKTQELAIVQQQKQQSDLRAEREVNFRNQAVTIALLLALIIYFKVMSHYERKVARTVTQANARLEAKVSDRTAALEKEMAQKLDAESQRLAMMKSLSEAEKLQALGQLTSGVAHDFNNLMTVVTLSAEQLQHGEIVIDDPGRKHVGNIISAAESASEITASLLAYARKQPLAPEPTNLATYMQDSLPLFESTLGGSIALEVSLAAGTVLVDRGQLTTAIINLLLNAKEAQQGGGRVLLEVVSDAPPNSDTHGNNNEQLWASFVVTDFGHGMNASEIERATQPFYTTKAGSHGTGLGLSMVDGFARQSGGVLQINSVIGERTTVTLRIPLCADNQSIRPTQATGNNTARFPAHGKVLIVDDQALIRNVLTNLLTQMGLDTMSAAGADEALQILGQQQNPDLLITDLMMPGSMNGEQLAAEVRNRYPNVPVLMMSGHASSLDADVEFLQKPFSLDEFRHAMDRAIKRSQTTKLAAAPVG